MGVPDLYAHLDKIEAATERPIRRLPHPRAIRAACRPHIQASKFLPNHGARFCTRMFKIETMNAYIASLGEPATLLVGCALTSRPMCAWAT